MCSCVGTCGKTERYSKIYCADANNYSAPKIGSHFSKMMEKFICFLLPSLMSMKIIQQQLHSCAIENEIESSSGALSNDADDKTSTRPKFV